MAYLVQRVTQLVLTLIPVSIITFGLLRIVPGSFADLAQQNGFWAGLEGVATGAGRSDKGDRRGWTT